LAVGKVNARKSNDLAYFWNSKDFQFHALYERSPTLGNALLLSANHAATVLRNATFEGVSLVHDGHGIRATLGSTGTTVNFSFDDEADLVFLSEVAFMCNLVMRLESTPGLRRLVNDQTPDSYSLGVSSLQKFAANSPEKFFVGQHIVDACLSQVISQLSSLYNGQFTAEVVFFSESKILRARQVVTNSTGYDAVMVNFQIILWTAIALVFITIAVIYIMVDLGNGGEADTILYRPKAHTT